MQKPAPIDVACDARCTLPCTELPPVVTPDPLSLYGAYLALVGLRESCEFRRGLCAECIERGRAAGAIH